LDLMVMADPMAMATVVLSVVEANYHDD